LPAVALLVPSLAAGCIETPRRSGVVDSLNRVSFAPPAAGSPAALPPSPAGAGDAGAGAAGGRGPGMSGAEVYTSGGRQTVTPGGRAIAARAEDGVTLNFDRADIREVVKVVLGEVLGRNYTIDAQVAGEITLASAAPVAEADLLGVLESALRGNNATLVDLGGGNFQVVPLENAPARPEVAPIGGRAPRLRPGYGVTIVPLRNIASTAAAQFIQPLVATPEDIRIDTPATCSCSRARRASGRRSSTCWPTST
jgi:general secretion pathway protein D